jgi:phage FluMu protein Com
MEQELTCKHCNRYLGKAFGSIVAELKCANSSCRGTTQFKIVQSDTLKDITHKFITPETPPKAKEQAA